MTVRNALYLRRRRKILVPAGTGELLPLPYVTSVAKNIESLGYGFSEALIAACHALTLEQLTALYQELIADLKALRGAHRSFHPMYPNFPSQVMETGESTLYLNALVHYWSGGVLFPFTEVKERLPLPDSGELTKIDLGTPEDFDSLFGQIAGSNTSLSAQDREDLTWFVQNFGDGIGSLLPPSIPQKENVTFIAGLLIKHTSHDRAVEFAGTFINTPTDVLRLAVALSDGDVSLATATRFRAFSRPERRLLLALLERQNNAVEDMLRWKGRWIRLGERLHPGEHAKKYERAAAAFRVLRSDEPYPTFNGQVEKALIASKIEDAVVRLVTRPGDFARRLDHVLRLDNAAQETVVAAFAEAAQKVSTPVLLQARHHFIVRKNTLPGLRVFFPKGNVAKAQGVENNLPPLPKAVCDRVTEICDAALKARFAALPSLGKVYVDPGLGEYLVPFAMRSSSKSLRTLVRGSRLPLPEGPVLRFFVWWKNGDSDTDIDLSATLFDGNFEYMDILSYYNLKGFGGVHSGDIVDAPEGASEFIDVSLEKVRAAGVHYIAMTLNSYTRQPFAELPECFAGWMARQEAGSGEIFAPKTVQDRLDLTAETKITIPLLIDVEDRKVIWCDMALRSDPKWQNNVHANLRGINLTLRSLVNLQKPNLYDLFYLHGQARGGLVDTPDEADTVFSVEKGTPFCLEEIASAYMV